MKRLEFSCPTKQYMLYDANLLARKRAFENILFMSLSELSHKLNKYQIMHSFTEYLSFYDNHSQNVSMQAFVAGWSAAGGKSNQEFETAYDNFENKNDLLKDRLEIFRENLEAITKQQRAIIKAYWVAFGNICRDLFEIEPATALATCQFSDELDELYETIEKTHEIDNDKYQYYEKVMRRIFDFETDK